jgi:hypothetical protein
MSIISVRPAPVYGKKKVSKITTPSSPFLKKKQTPPYMKKVYGKKPLPSPFQKKNKYCKKKFQKKNTAKKSMQDRKK